MTNFVTEGDNTIEAHSPGLEAFLRLLVTLKYISPEIEVHEALQPTHDVAVGFRVVKVASINQLGDEGLKRRCLELAEQVYQFLEDEAMTEADRAETEGLVAAHADIATMRQYRRRLKRQATATLRELKRRDWWEPESLNSEERKRLENPDSPSDVQEIAERPSAICRSH
jgi:hypothetical protein